MNRRFLVVVFVGGSVAVSALAVQFASARQRSRAAEMPADVRKTGEKVDAVLQERFRRRLEIFGVRRVALPGDGDMRHARSSTPADLARLKDADTLNCDYRVFFYPTRRLSADKLTSMPRRYAGSVEPLAGRDTSLAWATTDKAMLSAVGQSVTREEARLRGGASLDKPIGDWWLMARPVKAEAGCISCHGAAKTGETLGVLLYTIKPQTLTATR